MLSLRRMIVLMGLLLQGGGCCWSRTVRVAFDLGDLNDCGT